MAYWSHFLYSEPLDLCDTNPESPLYIGHPYSKSKHHAKGTPSNKLRLKYLRLVEKVMDLMMMSENRFLNLDRLGDYVLRKKFQDLALYYHKDNVALEEAGVHAQKLIREELAKTLRKHRRKKIMLISHSMGTVIAYDVLTQIVPEIKIEYLITLGSPLGLPTIMKKIFKEQHEDFKNTKSLPTPENIVGAWLNYSDLKDTVALNYNLCDDFSPNAAGIAPVDTVVVNDYEYEGQENRHKSYGYLRTPEIAATIHEFVGRQKLPRVARIGQVLTGLFKDQLPDEQTCGPEGLSESEQTLDNHSGKS